VMEYDEAYFAKHGLPTPPALVLKVRYSMGNGDWHIWTTEGWYYCRTQDVEVERRKWVPSVYGPTA
jgi:hypothetical protein